MTDLNHNRVAIIGMSGLYPEAASLEQFYQNLQEGRDSVRKLSSLRIKYNCLDPKRVYRPTAHLDRIDTFDHKFFNISKREAELIEPTQRLLLELACAAIENAGYSLDAMQGSKTAVYLGGRPYAGFHYYMLMNQMDPQAFTGTLPSMACGRISYLLNLTGPAMMIDVGCSSSLVAIHQACQELIAGTIDYALVGGVNVKLAFVEESNQGHLGTFASDGRCKPFDALADGIGDGEGGGILLLKRLDKALADHDVIQAVLRGSAVNHDGKRSNGLTTPSPAAQTEVIQQAWEKAGVAPETITYIEAHGTGTRLGDPVEFRGISDAFNANSSKRHFCAVGSVKSNIGHLDNAAGVTGVIKSVLSLKHRQLLPSLHFETPNPYIDFENSAAYVNSTLQAWTPADNSPRRCGVSSYGLSGTNAHLVLEEAPDRPDKPANNPAPQLLKISAKSSSAWAAFVDTIEEYLQTAEKPLADILYTLNTGRSDLAYRWAVPAPTKAELLTAIASLKVQLPTTPIQPLDDKDRKVVLLCSSEQPDLGQTSILTNTYPIFAETLAEVKQALGVDVLTGSANVVAVQFALYKLWLSFGVTVKTVIGTGAGRVTAQLIGGTLKLSELADAIARSEESVAINEAKLKTAVTKLISAESPIFLEMGSAGTLAGTISGWPSGEQNLTVLYALEQTTCDPVVSQLTAFYNAGGSIDWKTVYACGTYQRVEAPTYPFDKIRCWYQDALSDQPEGPHDWLYTLNWTPEPIANDTNPLTGQTFLLVDHQSEDADVLVNRLRQHRNRCIRVRIGNVFQQIDADTYEIDGHQQDDYVRLETELRQQAIPVQGIIQLSAYVSPQPSLSDTLDATLQSGLYAQFFLAKAFARQLASKGFQFVVITANASQVIAADGVLNPASAPIIAFLKGMAAEYPSLKVSSIDLSYAETSASELTSTVLNEMATDETIRFVAYRNQQRYVQQIVPLQVDAEPVTGQLNPNGVYLITGGTSGIGFEVAQSLANRGRCHLLILGRTNLPPEDEWATYANQPGDSIGEKIQALQTLKNRGSVVQYYAVDVADKLQMQRVFTDIQARYSSLDGVIHSAGIGNSGVSIVNRQFTDLRATLMPKVHGTLLLDEYCQRLHPGFFVLFSSLNSIVPARNSADYAAANAFEDAFACQARLRGSNCTTIHWPDWNETGLSFRKRTSSAVDEEGLALKSISTQDGLTAFYHALHLNQAEVAVANVDLASFRINPFFRLDSSTASVSPAALTTPLSGSARPIQAINQEERTTTETKLMLIWNDVLKLDQIQLKDDFFEIGGHSLNGRQVLNRIEKEFGVALEFEHLFTFNTLRALAGHIDQRIQDGQSATYASIQPLPAGDHYAVSHAQKRLWLLYNFGLAKEAYHVPSGYTFTGTVNVKALEKAFQTLVERHESLRTVFRMIDGELRQIILSPSAYGFKLDYLDLRHTANVQHVVDDLTLTEAATPFDLQTGPLMRVKLVQLTDEQFVCLITMHHILTDARSMNVLRNEIAALYKAFQATGTNPLTPLRIHYKDYVGWVNEQLQGEAFQAHKQYWLKRLAGPLPVLALPTDYAMPRQQTFEAHKYRFLLNQDVSDRLKTLSDTQGVTLYITLMSLYTVLLHKYSNQTDIIIGSPISGRNHYDLDNQIGIYLNTLVSRTTIRPGERFRELLGRVKETSMLDYEHQVYPFDLLVEDLNMAQADAPVFNAAFTWTLHEEVSESVDIGFEIDDYYTGFNKAKADLWLHGTVVNQEIALSFVYKTDLFKPETIQLLAERFKAVIAQVLQNPDQPIEQLTVQLAFEPQLTTSAVEIDFDFS